MDQQNCQKMISSLLCLKEDRGIMSRLRKGLNESTEHRAWPILSRWVLLSNDRDRALAVCVSGCYATHPHHDKNQGDFGRSLRALAFSRSGDDPLKRFSSRFGRILSCDSRAEACAAVVRYIRSLKSESISVNYNMLAEDLLFWNDKEQGKRTKLRWAASYWGVSTEEAE